MVFSSLEFLLLYLTVTLLLYFIVPLKLRNIVLLVVSLIFYGWGEPVYMFLMMFTIVVDYIFGMLVEKSLLKNDRKHAKMFMIIAISTASLNIILPWRLSLSLTKLFILERKALGR